MTKQPWLKFYPSDFRSDLTLLTSSLAARGLWIEMLCIMSENEPRGTLVRKGEPYSIADLAIAVRAPVKEVERLLSELEREGVFSRTSEGAIFSRRIHRDIKKAEADKANGQRGGNPRLKVIRNG